MTRSRLVVCSALVVVTVGVFAALAALLLNPGRGAVGPLPAEGLVLPAQSRFVVGLDIPRLAASPVYGKLTEGLRGAGLDALRTLEQTTGIDPTRDVEQVLLGGGQDVQSLVLVLGDFDPEQLGRAIEERASDGITWHDVQGTKVYLIGETAAPGASDLALGLGAVAFLDERSIAIGSQSGVEAAIASRAEGAVTLKSNEELMRLLESVEPGAAFWMVGDDTLLGQLPDAVPVPGGTSLALPSLTSVVASGNVDPLLALKITGEAADEAGARMLADMARGATGLVALRAGTNPELGKLASAISVTTEANRVHVNARFPYELIEALLPDPGSSPQEAELAPEPE